MTFENLLKKKEEIRFQIKRIIAKVEELRGTYFPGKSESEITVHSNTSPQEIIILRIDALNQKIAKLIKEEVEIDKRIERKLDLIENPRDRWVVYQKINHLSLAKIGDEEGYSYTHIKRIYKKALDLIHEREQKCQED